MKLKNSAMIILAGTLWGTMGLFVHALTDCYGFSTMQSACLRVCSAAVMLFLFITIYDRRLLRIDFRDVWVFLCTGIFSVLCMTLFYFRSINSGTSMSVSAILLYTAPIIVMLVSCLFLGESFTSRKLSALLCAFAGCVLVSLGDGTHVTAEGIVFGLLSGVSYASYSLIGAVALRKYHPFTVTFYSFLFAGVGSLFVGDVRGISQTLVSGSFSLPLMTLIFALGFVTAFAPYLLYTKGLSGVETGKAAIMAAVEPVVAALCGLFKGESLTLPIILGIVGILTAIIILNTGKKDNT